MVKENVDLSLVGSSVTSLIMYKAVMKIFLNSTYGPASLPSLSGGSTRSREIALFMIMGTPAVVGALLTINKVTSGGTKVIVNIAEGNNLEGTGTSSASSSSLFLFINKLPS